MGMRIDTARTRKCLYGITIGLTTKELVDYTGYEQRTIKKYRQTQNYIKRNWKKLKKSKMKNGFHYGRKYLQMSGKK